jgi:hypothetical protein
MWPETMTWHEVAHQAVHQPWWRSLHFTTILPIVISFVALCGTLVALAITLWDRRPQLVLRPRRGDWCKLEPSFDRAELIFKGVVEVYNVSARANAIREYEFWGKRIDEDWEKMESELYNEYTSVNDRKLNNLTPLTLEPYSGSPISVMAFGKMPPRQPFEMEIKVRVQDLFGKWHETEVRALS